MNKQKETTAFVSSVGADERQSINVSENSISLNCEKIKNFEAISMSELYDTVYPSKPPLIDELLYHGVYLFVGAPKIGKSFLMAQLAYHISTGIPIWNYTVRKGTALYLALEDDYRRLQERLYRMFGTDSTDNLFSQFQRTVLEMDWTLSYSSLCRNTPTQALLSLIRSKKLEKSAVIITATQTIMKSSHG